MTITVSSLVAGPFTATGASQALPFAFKVFSADEIEVYYGGAEIVVAPADYTVARNTSVVGDALEGGTVTLDAGAVAAGQAVSIRAVPEFIQEQVYSSAGTRLENLNEALDRGTLRDIFLNDKLDRAIAAAGELLGLIGKVSFTTLASSIGATLMGYINTGTGAVLRTVRVWMGDRSVSIKDYGAVSGTDASAAVLAAYNAGHYDLYAPPGVYDLGALGLLGAAGIRIKGAGRGVNGFLTTIRPLATMIAGEAIFFHQAAAAGTSAYGLIEDLSFDLRGQNATAIDLASCNNFNINRVHIKGGTNLASANGTGIKFGSPRDEGSYSNTLTHVSLHALAVCVKWGVNANSNMMIGGECINSNIGADCAPVGYLDTPRIIGTRFEGCNVGVREKSQLANYVACRFEDNASADIEFVNLGGGDQSFRPRVMGCNTATSPVSLLNLANAISPVIDSPDMGNYDIETTDNKKFRHGRHIFASKNTAINPATPTFDYALYMYDILAMRSQVGIESRSAASAALSVNMLFCDALDRTNLVTYKRDGVGGGVYGDLIIGGGGSVMPVTHGVTSLGKDANRFYDIFASNSVFAANVAITGDFYVDGVKVLGSQGAAIADAAVAAAAPTKAEFDALVGKFNTLLSRLRTHGQIAT